MSTDRAQKVHGKNGAICLVIMFVPRVMVIKMSKMAHFLYFLLMLAKNQLQFGQTIMCIWKFLLSFLRKHYGLLDSELPLGRHQHLKVQCFIIFFADSTVLWYFYPQYSQTLTPNTMNHRIFWKNSKRSFRFTF